MIFKPKKLLSVYYCGGPIKHRVGRLLYKDRTLFFEYDSAFIKHGLELSPFKLPLKPGVVTVKERVFDGLFGLFNDSLPDGWGRLLLDRKLAKMGYPPETLSPLDRLYFVGSSGMGALTYEPEYPAELVTAGEELDTIAQKVETFQKDHELFVEELLTLNSSSAGARPKIAIRFAEEDWLVKFRSASDPKDMGAIEYAYHLMAQKAGLDVPAAKLFPSRESSGYFGVQRFDRGEGKPIHMHTISGLLHADHRVPCLDYEGIMKATLFLTRDVRQCEKLFRNAAFNLLSHNRDDHAKNFAYLMDANGTWRVSPAYDLTFSSGPGGEHATLFMGEGRNPGKGHLLRLAAIGEVDQPKALRMLEEVMDAVAQWRHFADVAGVSPSSATMIQKALAQVARIIG